jgi:ribonucleoside-diphosphate reductase alpha chain
MTSILELKKSGEAPEWLSQDALQMLQNGYLYKNETPKDMYKRVAKSAASYLKRPELEDRFFDLMWKNWLCPSTPVLTNAGTDRGFDISCFSSYVPDTTIGIMDSLTEVAMLSKYGGGTAWHASDVRAKGTPISKGGTSDGVVPFLKMLDSVILGISQGNVRRGSCAAYVNIEHGDFDEFISSRRPTGDVNRQCLNLHHGVCVSDAFMKKVEDGDVEARRRWKELLKSRVETGEPYIFFTDTVNRDNPEMYKKLGLDVKGSNLCTEITLHTDIDHTFVCCLSSLNLARFHEWKDTDAAYLAVWFLDGIMEEFIDKAANTRGFEKAIKFAVKSRALGLGVLGFHSYLQSNMIPFDSFEAYIENKIIFKSIQDQAKKATRDLAEAYGEPEWCKGFGVRNTHLLSVAPTTSNSLISSNVSQGIEPWAANIFAQKSAKGTFVRKNPELIALLDSKNKNIDEVWKSILANEGSVQQLDFLSAQEKEVFLTAREINQFAIVKLASERQKFIDQGQSLNLFFPVNADPKYINQVHFEAFRSGVKTLYYLRSQSVLKADAGKQYSRENTCTWCEG